MTEILETGVLWLCYVLKVNKVSWKKFLESSIFNLEQILHPDFTIKFYTLCSNFAIADF